MRTKLKVQLTQDYSQRKSAQMKNLHSHTGAAWASAYTLKIQRQRSSTASLILTPLRIVKAN